MPSGQRVVQDGDFAASAMNNSFPFLADDVEAPYGGGWGTRVTASAASREPTTAIDHDEESSFPPSRRPTLTEALDALMGALHDFNAGVTSPRTIECLASPAVSKLSFTPSANVSPITSARSMRVGSSAMGSVGDPVVVGACPSAVPDSTAALTSAATASPPPAPAFSLHPFRRATLLQQHQLRQSDTETEARQDGWARYLHHVREAVCSASCTTVERRALMTDLVNRAMRLHRLVSMVCSSMETAALLPTAIAREGSSAGVTVAPPSRREGVGPLTRETTAVGTTTASTAPAVPTATKSAAMMLMQAMGEAEESSFSPSQQRQSSLTATEAYHSTMPIDAINSRGSAPLKSISITSGGCMSMASVVAFDCSTATNATAAPNSVAVTDVKRGQLLSGLVKADIEVEQDELLTSAALGSATTSVSSRSSYIRGESASQAPFARVRRSSHTLSREGKELINGLRVCQELGRGTTGSVRLCIDRGSRRPYAIKSVGISRRVALARRHSFESAASAVTVTAVTGSFTTRGSAGGFHAAAAMAGVPTAREKGAAGVPLSTDGASHAASAEALAQTQTQAQTLSYQPAARAAAAAAAAAAGTARGTISPTPQMPATGTEAITLSQRPSPGLSPTRSCGGQTPLRPGGGSGGGGGQTPTSVNRGPSASSAERTAMTLARGNGPGSTCQSNHAIPQRSGDGGASASGGGRRQLLPSTGSIGRSVDRAHSSCRGGSLQAHGGGGAGAGGGTGSNSALTARAGRHSHAATASTAADANENATAPAAHGHRSASTTESLSPVEREIRVLRRLRHRHIVKLHEVIDDEEEGLVHLVLDYVPNGPITHARQYDHKLGYAPCDVVRPLSQLREFAYELAGALQHLQSRLVVHNDLKPENILMDATGHIVLTDFGESVLLSHSLVRQNMNASVTAGNHNRWSNLAPAQAPNGAWWGSAATTTDESVSQRDLAAAGALPSCRSFGTSIIAGGGMLDWLQPDSSMFLQSGVGLDGKLQGRLGAGTPAFSPPELIDRNECSFKTDVWSYGVLLYGMLFGRLPFAGPTLMDTLQAVLRAELTFPTLAEVPANEEFTPESFAEWQTLCRHLLVRAPSERMSVGLLLKHPLIRGPVPLPLSLRDNPAAGATPLATAAAGTMSTPAITLSASPHPQKESHPPDHHKIPQGIIGSSLLTLESASPLTSSDEASTWRRWGRWRGHATDNDEGHDDAEEDRVMVNASTPASPASPAGPRRVRRGLAPADGQPAASECCGGSPLHSGSLATTDATGAACSASGTMTFSAVRGGSHRRSRPCGEPGGTASAAGSSGKSSPRTAGPSQVITPTADGAALQLPLITPASPLVAPPPRASPRNRHHAGPLPESPLLLHRVGSSVGCDPAARYVPPVMTAVQVSAGYGAGTDRLGVTPTGRVTPSTPQVPSHRCSGRGRSTSGGREAGKGASGSRRPSASRQRGQGEQHSAAASKSRTAA